MSNHNTLTQAPVRRDRTHAWPKPPEGLASFTLNLHRPQQRDGTWPKPKYQRRLRDLSKDQLLWLAKSIHVEVLRRRQDGAS